MEWMARQHRYKLFAAGAGKNILEVGIGTGKSIPFYPAGSTITAIEPSAAMRTIAQQRAQQSASSVSIVDGDVHHLQFSDNSFDLVVDSFVFCSVVDPVRGLQEIYRVLRPGGQLRMIEHVRPAQRWLARLFDWLNPLVLYLMGANINRRTEANLLAAGFSAVVSEPLHRPGIIRYFQAHKKVD